jgi:hypothetical protein
MVSVFRAPHLLQTRWLATSGTGMRLGSAESRDRDTGAAPAGNCCSGPQAASLHGSSRRWSPARTGARLGLAPARGLFTVPLKLDQLGEPRDELRDPAGLVVTEPNVRDSNSAIRLAIRHAPDEMVWPPGLIQIGPNLYYRCLLKF